MSFLKLRLLVAIVLAGASLAFLGVTLNSAKTPATAHESAAPLKAKILRPKNKLKDKPDAAEIVELRKQSGQDAAEERKFEDEIPKHVPIEFRLKADKEKKFKDLKNPDWYRDFELEVTNTSDKPIYYLELWLEYAGIDAAPGVPLAVPLRYGRIDFVYHDTRPQPTDVPIAPGETFIFTIPESDQKGWEWHKKHEGTPDPTKTLLRFVDLSFGDGTGYDTLQAVPYPYRRNRSATSACRGGPALVTQWWQRPG